MIKPRLLSKKNINQNFIRIGAGIILLFSLSYILGLNLVIPISLLAVFGYLKVSAKSMNLKEYDFLHLFFLFIIIFVTSYFILQEGWGWLFIPFCAVTMLTAILFDQLELALLVGFVSSVTVAYLVGNNFLIGLLFFSSGLVSSMLVFRARRRIVIIRAGFIAGLIQVLSLLCIEHFHIYQPNRYLVLFLNGIASSIVVVGILPVFEYLFKTVTNVSLLELTDLNHPLLARMVLETPGTYHHSLIVGNLSEAACSAIGANALLARIGAYYHDIGKLEKPLYFSENQDLPASKHDALTPTISKLIIMNHVKEGIEIAHKYKLNPRIVDFIQQHHGTSLVYYFYRRALENIEEDGEIKEEGFRYPGPKPKTKEAAVVLLADSTEAAVRALKEALPATVEEVVHKIINNKFIDGQLDECDLTLKDLEKIAVAFIRLLSAIYHSRLTYP
ncbi:MAG: hypothetical protein A2166_01625 [Omnitrophica WOR_2 bacterium RBG_13_41_10]|nr:MAG: hypothetical protein A2166_01625 [Omnitrophica WOR_2 bacterium RBG_13_41_10]